MMDNRERIIEGAAELFRVYGIKAVTMDQLAGQLTISKRTIYELFADKDELLVGVLKWMAEKQKIMIKKVLNDSDNAIEAIFKFLEINVNHFQQMSPAFQNDIKRFHHEVLMKKTDKYDLPDFTSYREVFERGIKDKLFRKDINPDIVNRCMYYLGRTILDNSLYPNELFTRKEVVNNVMISYLRGISTPLGLELINKYGQKF
jgi:TetR/AcrR family transcriptional regulator, cholesterol catabolism regulator